MSQKALIGHEAILNRATLTNVKVKRKDVIGDQEIRDMQAKADQITDTFQKLRAKAVIALLETGKRRSEIASLEILDITEDQTNLYVKFTLRKKRKKSLNLLQRTKKYDLTSRYAQDIREYLSFLKQKHPNVKHVFPRAYYVFGHLISLDENKSCNPKEIWRIVKSLNSQDWPHQHRERRAVKVIRKDEERFGETKLETVYRVKKVLDLEREQTAWNYIRRHETQKVEEEDETVG